MTQYPESSQIFTVELKEHNFTDIHTCTCTCIYRTCTFYTRTFISAVLIYAPSLKMYNHGNYKRLRLGGAGGGGWVPGEGRGGGGATPFNR